MGEVGELELCPKWIWGDWEGEMEVAKFLLFV